MTTPPPASDPLSAHSLSPAELTEVLKAQRRDAACLIWRGEDGALRIRSLDEDRRTWAIGRQDGMDVVIADPQVSRLHARLERDGAEWAIVDLGMSSNGTFVNARRVLARARLDDDDRIRLGRTIVAIKIRSPTPVLPTVRAGAPSAVPALTQHQRRVLVALCRPLVANPGRGEPASNREIAGEVHIEVKTVKVHLSRVFTAFGLAGVKPNEKRRRLAAYALEGGIVTSADMTSAAGPTPPDKRSRDAPR